MRADPMLAPELLYYLAFALYFFAVVLGRTTLEDFLFVPIDDAIDALQAVVLLLLLCKFVFQRAPLSSWVLAAALVLVDFISWRQSAEGWLFWLALFVVCGEGVRLRPLAAISLVMSLTTVLVATSLASMGFVEDVVSSRAGVVRHAMGFSHPNSLGLYLLSACVSFSVLRFGKNPLPDILLIGVADAVNLAVADSRSTVLLSFVQVLLLLVFYTVKSERGRGVARAGICAGVLAVFALSMYLMVAYDASSGWQSSLNQLLSGRLNLAHSYYEMQPLTLFGSSFEGFEPIYWENGEPVAFLVDNAWCHLVLRYGVVPTACLLTGMFLLFKRLVTRRRWDALLFGLTLMAVYGFTETYGIRIECNYFLFALGAELLYGPRAARGAQSGRNKAWEGLPAKPPAAARAGAGE
ncbi:MAG: hypothetical protein Q4C41_09235 [Eggerthellaceae bacterium]|nr:hypothetical protein [Eggerthellaceae bacterium]